MRTITATIEKASDGGYGIYTDIPGLIGSGLTEEEAKADFVEYSKNKPHTITNVLLHIPIGMKKVMK